MTLLNRISALQPQIGNTPIKKIDVDGVHCYVKLEYNNLSGSIKDRPAFNILRQAIADGKVHEGVTIVESSSGNFAIALATICHHLNLRFITVIDPNINKQYEDILRLLAYQVIKVTERDETGGYLLNRIREVDRIAKGDPNIFWTNQYSNPNNYLAYFNDLGGEVGREIKKLDCVFVAVSSCGTITGLSLRLKELYPDLKVIGVDIEGSLIFQSVPKRRHISGIGSSQKSSVIELAQIDHVVHVTHQEIIRGCWDLLSAHSTFAGASTGAVYSALQQSIANGWLSRGANVLCLACDRGNAYMDTIYNRAWIQSMAFEEQPVSPLDK